MAFRIDLTWVINDYGTLQRDVHEIKKFQELDQIIEKSGRDPQAIDEIVIYPIGERTTLSDQNLDL